MKLYGDDSYFKTAAGIWCNWFRQIEKLLMVWQVQNILLWQHQMKGSDSSKMLKAYVRVEELEKDVAQ